MLLVPTYVAPSAIHGLGLFAAEPIPAGTVVWRFNSVLDRVLDRAWAASLPEVAQQFLARYAYRRGTQLVLCGDDGRFVNHSDAPTLAERPDTASVAARDIAAGEELTEDYRAFDDDFVTKGLE